MFANRRPGKRSIVGTRVCAPSGDGLYAPGQIVSVSGSSGFGSAGRHQRYAVEFDSGVVREHFTEHDLIGPGFQPLTSVRLRPGQTVFITHNGRETKGRIVEWADDGRCVDEEGDDFKVDVDDEFEKERKCPLGPSESPSVLCVSIAGQNGEFTEVMRKVEDVRLIESRKSARLIDQVDSAPIEFAVAEAKKRTVSTVIDVPKRSAKHIRGNYNGGPDHEEELEEEDMQYEDVTLSRDVETELMDEHTAALVLTSLSCSPVSPVFFSPRRVPSTGGSSSSGVWSTAESSIKSTPSTPSPPKLLLSHSAPADVHMFNSACLARGEGASGRVLGVAGGGLHRRRRRLDYQDEKGGDRKEEGDAFDDSAEEENMQIAKRIVYRCTWPGCSKMYNTSPGIEKHVRIEHLGPKDDNNIMDENEEEFYFTEVEVTLDTVMQTFADMYTSSSPSSASSSAFPTRDSCKSSVIPVPLGSLDEGVALQKGPSWPPSDHDYQRKEFRSTPLSIPSSSRYEDSLPQQVQQRKQQQLLGLSLPLTGFAYRQPAMSSSLPMSKLPLSPLSPPVSTEDIAYSYSAVGAVGGGGGMSSHKKSRTEVKKCRKIYGLESRSLWCTQCKWKKACTRFHEKGEIN